MSEQSPNRCTEDRPQQLGGIGLVDMRARRQQWLQGRQGNDLGGKSSRGMASR